MSTSFQLFAFLMTFFIGYSQIQAKPKSVSKAEMQKYIVHDWGYSLTTLKSPEDFIKRYESRLNEQDKKYLRSLIKDKKWVEMPKIKVVDSSINFTVGNKTTELLVEDYFSKKFTLNGVELNLGLYKSAQEQIQYIQRVLKTKKTASLWNLLINSAEASITCSALMDSGCVEVSLATSVWMANVAASDTNISRCKNIYYFNKRNDATKICLEKYKNDPNMLAIQGFADVLADNPNTEIEITCNSDQGPDIYINGKEVTRLGKGKWYEDYSIDSAMDPDRNLRKIPQYAIACCEAQGKGELGDACVSFVNNHLGKSSQRNEIFGKDNIRRGGKKLKGAK